MSILWFLAAVTAGTATLTVAARPFITRAERRFLDSYHRDKRRADNAPRLLGDN